MRNAVTDGRRGRSKARGFIVWALPPTRRAVLRDAMQVIAVPPGSRAIDRTVIGKLIDTAFDEIEAAAQVDEQRGA